MNTFILPTILTSEPILVRRHNSLRSALSLLFLSIMLLAWPLKAAESRVFYGWHNHHAADGSFHFLQSGAAWYERDDYAGINDQPWSPDLPQAAASFYSFSGPLPTGITLTPGTGAQQTPTVFLPGDGLVWNPPNGNANTLTSGTPASIEFAGDEASLPRFAGLVLLPPVENWFSVEIYDATNALLGQVSYRPHSTPRFVGLAAPRGIKKILFSGVAAVDHLTYSTLTPRYSMDRGLDKFEERLSLAPSNSVEMDAICPVLTWERGEPLAATMPMDFGLYAGTAWLSWEPKTSGWFRIGVPFSQEGTEISVARGNTLPSLVPEILYPSSGIDNSADIFATAGTRYQISVRQVGGYYNAYYTGHRVAVGIQPTQAPSAPNTSTTATLIAEPQYTTQGKIFDGQRRWYGWTSATRTAIRLQFTARDPRFSARLWRVKADSSLEELLHHPANVPFYFMSEAATAYRLSVEPNGAQGGYLFHTEAYGTVTAFNDEPAAAYGAYWANRIQSSTLTATRSATEPAVSTNPSAGIVWYRFEGSMRGQGWIENNQPTIPLPPMKLFTAQISTTDPNTLVPISEVPLRAESFGLSFDVTPNYFLLGIADGEGFEKGFDFSLKGSGTDYSPPPPNDAFVATRTTYGSTHNFSSYVHGATFEADEADLPASPDTHEGSVWYRWLSEAEEGQVRIGLSGADLNHTVTLYRGTRLNQLVKVPITLLGDEPAIYTDGLNLTRVWTAKLAAGQYYALRIDGRGLLLGTASKQFAITIRPQISTTDTAPSTVASLGNAPKVHIDTLLMAGNADTGEPLPAGQTTAETGTWWWRWTAPVGGVVRLSGSLSPFVPSTAINAWNGLIAAPTTSEGLNKLVTVNAGDVLYLQVTEPKVNLPKPLRVTLELDPTYFSELASFGSATTPWAAGGIGTESWSPTLAYWHWVAPADGRYQHFAYNQFFQRTAWLDNPLAPPGTATVPVGSASPFVGGSRYLLQPYFLFVRMLPFYAPRPANDAFVLAQDLGSWLKLDRVAPEFATLINSSVENDEPAHGYPDDSLLLPAMTGSTWYRWSPPYSGWFEARLDELTDSRLRVTTYVYRGSTPALLYPELSAHPIWDDNPSILPIGRRFYASLGQVYYISVVGDATHRFQIEFEIRPTRPYEVWLLGQGLSTDLDPSHNPTGDGMDNLTKFALGLKADANNFTTDQTNRYRIPRTIEHDDGTLEMRFFKDSANRTLEDQGILDFDAEISSDLFRWEHLSGAIERIGVTDEYKIVVPPQPDGVRRFLRLAVDYEAPRFRDPRTGGGGGGGD